MEDVLRAFGRAVRSLTQPAMLWHLIWPTLVAVALWGALAWLFWSDLAAWLMGLPWMAGLLETGESLATAAAAATHVVLALLLLPLVYASAVLLAATVALPLMLERVARRDYPQLERRGGGTLAGSLGNALAALAVYLLGLLLTLPLWLIPGLGLVVLVLWSAYLNQRTYRYDALMAHADAREMHALIRARRSDLMMVGIGAGLLAYVPVINLVAPAFAGLAFVHYCLAALKRWRAKEH